MRTIHNICTTTTKSRVHPAFYHRTNICSVFSGLCSVRFSILDSRSYVTNTSLPSIFFASTFPSTSLLLLLLAFFVVSFTFHRFSSLLFFFRFSSQQSRYIFLRARIAWAAVPPAFGFNMYFFSLLSLTFGQTLQSETLTRLDMMKISHFSRIKICFLLLLFSHFIPPSGKLFYVEHFHFEFLHHVLEEKFSASQIYEYYKCVSMMLYVDMGRDLNSFS